MWVIDELTRCPVEYNLSVRIIIKHTEDCIIYGYTFYTTALKFYIKQNEQLCQHYFIKEIFIGETIFSKKLGYYISKVGLTLSELYFHQAKGFGDFPYSFGRKYEAVENFDLFKDKQVLESKRYYSLSKELKYTFGLEFETSCGYIPEDLCFKLGLIPLRDGSIRGLEYSTVVLQGNYGLNLLKEQLSVLKEYTDFDKECSLHIHFGNFPLNEEKILRVNNLFAYLQNDIEQYVPRYTFSSSLYKANGKDYCKKISTYRSFDTMYSSIVGTKYFGSLYQAHPRDIKRCRKWQVLSRYKAVNFVNLLCYDVNKTIEFRFLRPTYNLNKIILWLYIFNAILKYAESDCCITNITTLKQLLTIYPVHLYNYLMIGLNKLKNTIYVQDSLGDCIGENISVEDDEFRNNILY